MHFEEFFVLVKKDCSMMFNKYELKEDSLERREKAEKVMSILKYMHKSEIHLLEQDFDGENDNELAYPFLEDDDQMSNKRKRKMSKIETDNFLMSTFSKEYKQVEDQVRKEMNLIDSDCCTEDLSSFNLNEMTNDYVEDPIFIEEVKYLLSLSGLDALFAEREKEAIEKRKGGKVANRDPKLFKPMPIQNVSDINSLSGLWRLLEGESVENGFPITEIGYNVLKDERLSWLHREDLPFERREEIRIKCEQWMKKCEI